MERFCKQHLGQPIGSSAVIERVGNRFRRDVKAFAADHGIPILALKKPGRSRWDDQSSTTFALIWSVPSARAASG